MGVLASTLVMRRSMLRDNVANGNGGAIAMHRVTARVSETIMSGNRGDMGGAVYATTSTSSDGSLLMEQCNVTGNAARRQGGAMWLDVLVRAVCLGGYGLCSVAG